MKRKSTETVTFPDLDEWGTPTAKLPNCPKCGENELGVIHEGLMLCYFCGWEQWRDRHPSCNIEDLT